MKKLIAKMAKRKLLSAVIILIAAVIAYWGYQKIYGAKSVTSYVTAMAEKGTIAVSVTGSGQVSATSQVDIKPKVSGDVIFVGVRDGDYAQAGALILQIDEADARKAVRDAEANLESAKITLEKLRGAEGATTPKNKQDAQDSLKKSYDEGYTAIANSFLDLPAVITGIQNILYGNDLNKSQYNVDYYNDAVSNFNSKILDYRNAATSAYQKVRIAYDKNFADFQSASRAADPTAIEALINETYATVIGISDATKNTNNFIQFYQDQLSQKGSAANSISNTHLTALNSYTSKNNSHLADLANVVNQIKTDKDSILNADLDVRSGELSVARSENALADAKEKLADYSIRTPFSGTVAKVSVKKADSISSATIVATLITKQKIAEISLNEVDAAKINAGQKVMLTFDAIENLSIAGQVSEIDSIGAVTQGVVTYAVKINFDTQDDRVKSGMSVNAAIITEIKQDVLMVPNSAVKTQGNTKYVEIFEAPLQGSQRIQGAPSTIPPKQFQVEIGLSNDTFTEIVSGLKEGDQVVTRIIAAAAVTTTQQAPSLLGGGARIGGGGVRIPTTGGGR